MANDNHALPRDTSGNEVSPWPLGYPLLLNSGQVTADEAGTLELLAAVGLGQSASMNRFAVNFGANDGKMLLAPRRTQEYDVHLFLRLV